MEQNLVFSTRFCEVIATNMLRKQLAEHVVGMHIENRLVRYTEGEKIGSSKGGVWGGD